MALSTPKSKKCKACGFLFTPFLSTQRTCGVSCAVIDVQEQHTAHQERQARKDLKVGREKLKTKSDHLNDAQKACNAFIRERDKNEPCISCGTMKQDIQYCAGHYKTRGGHPELRFHPMNIHKQCNHRCNLHLSGNVPEYRLKLIKKIGLKNVEWLEGPHEAQNPTIEDIKDIRQWYKDQLKALKSEI